ncbi:phospholipase D-like domain-containing protein [Paracoccus sp. TOH]|uniref:phospholipase D-like domain-containing protein n=1 Tax=Paracoccus sp. TOH TaxID=1263728 RepID=UPI0025B094D0|nr:phospholipase D-like domain-containing protein [Paracoccus sp. TOH]WJS86401.1 phospholipase D-like domain-containing protein [Paracoccus sp. TOH]
MDTRGHYDTIYDRLTETVRLRPNEAVRSVDPNSIDVREGFVEVRHETLPNLPEKDAKAIAKIVSARRAGNTIKSTPQNRLNSLDLPELTVPWNEDDLVIGGSSQRLLFEDVVNAAVERIVVLSTFIEIGNVDQLWPILERAAERGVNIDLLYGAAGDDASKHGARAQELSKRAALSRFSNRISVHKDSIASHSKFLIADNGMGSYVAILGSCNWLSTPFNAVEMSYIVRHPAFVAQVAAVIRRTTIGAKLSNDLVSFLGSLSRWGDATVSTSLSAENVGVKLKLILANEHAAIIRRAATEAKERLIIGSHRFGSTAEQAMLVAAANAAKNIEDMRVIYCMIRKPQFRSDVTALRKQYEPKGVQFVHLDTQKKRTPIHGKYLIWDADNAVVTSLNWASAAVSDEDQTSELGVHFEGPGIGEAILRKLQKEVPQIDGDFLTKAKKR